MSMKKKIDLIIKNPKQILVKIIRMRLPSRFMSDELAIRLLYKLKMDKKLNLNPPRTYNEKLQWLKLYDRNPIYPKIVDKYEVRKYIAEKVGENFLVPLIGVYDKFEDINFDDFPNSFVIKCTHNSGGVVICRNKSDFNYTQAQRIINKNLKKNYYLNCREWPYKNVQPKIICERLIETADGNPPRDIKVFCFNGIPKALFVASDRGRGTKFDFFDIDWNKLDVKQHYPNSDYRLSKPENWEVLLEASRKISEDFPHLRVDFYLDKYGNPLIGELTLTHFAGWFRFEPDSYDLIFGDWLKLPHNDFMEGIK